MIGTHNTTVYAIREARTLLRVARDGKRRRKMAERVPPTPLTREQRVTHYANQSGWTSDFTPRQRRRLDHKSNRAKTFRTTDNTEAVAV